MSRAFFMAPRRIRRKRHETAAAAPPVGEVHVEQVHYDPMVLNAAEWFFDKAITDPDDVTELRINGQPGSVWDRGGPNHIQVTYDGDVAEGMPWTCPADAGGIHGTDGETLPAGSGIVEGD